MRTRLLMRVSRGTAAALGCVLGAHAAGQDSGTPIPDQPKPVGLPFVSIHPAPLPSTERAASVDVERAITCPPGSVPEGETNCGVPEDTINGGCNALIPSFSNLICGATYCGTGAYNGAVRDTDWYQITVGQKRYLTWTVTSDFRALIGLIAGTNGIPNCAAATGVDPFAIVSPGQTQSVSVCVNAGTWWFFVAPDLNQGNVTCGAKYYATLTCSTTCPSGACCLPDGGCNLVNGLSACAALGGRYQGDLTGCSAIACDPPPNDACANAEEITCNSSSFADTRNATLAPGEQGPACVPDGPGSVWYKFVGTGGSVTFSTCDSANLDPLATDSILGVYLSTNQCLGLFQVGCNDDAACGPTQRLSSVCVSTSPGSTYYIQVLPYNNATRGVYKLDAFCPCTPGVQGACCLANGACQNVSRSQCTFIGGQYRGDGSNCSGVTCENLPPPPNDDCDAAVQLIVPSTTNGYTLYGFSDGDNLPPCGPIASGPGVWYRVSGTGHEITAAVCGGVTDFDSRLYVFCGDCAVPTPLVCVAANDDAAGGCGAGSLVSWCSEPGRNYMILVAGGSASSGHFTLELTQDPAPCPAPASCSASCTVTCPGGSINENEPPCFLGYVDESNGGCGTTPNHFGTIACGQTVCGTSGTFDSISGAPARDTDWFRFTITQESVVTWTVTADFMVQAFILNNDCADTFAYAGRLGNACQPVAVTATLSPGTYNVFVSPQFFNDAVCGSHWKGTLTCTPTPSNGACCLTACSCTLSSEVGCLLTLGGIYWAGAGTTCAQTNCNPCATDFNHDGITNTTDLTRLLLYFGVNGNADVNCDGQTNISDLVLLLVQFGRTCP